MERGGDMWPETGRWMTVFLTCCLLIFEPALPAAAGKHQVMDGAHGPILLAKEDGKNWERYKNLSPEEQAQLKKKLRQWQSLSPEEQTQMRKKMNQLNQMPPEARKLYQKRFNQWQRLSPQEQERLRRQLENWDNLSPAEKESIRSRFK